MKTFWIILGCVSMWTGVVSDSNAATVIINPSADGSIYTCPSCNPVSNDGYVLVAGDIQGIVEFSMMQVNHPIESAVLSLNPYGLPLYGETIEVYGYESNDGILTAADGFSGTFLGTWNMPANIGYGEDIFFDVGTFLSTASSAYVGFNLRSYTGTNVYSSLEYNYDHPSQLIVNTVPIPAASLLLFSGLMGIFSLVKKSRG